MAGHSQFKNIMHRKGAQDKKRGKIFTKIIKEIVVAVKTGGDDLDSNPRLRSAIQAAKAANMPKDNIERNIKKAAGGDDTTDYFEMRYEGYGPGGVPVIVEALTDNRNRTAPDVRACFSKFGGNMGETGSVSFMFDRLGCIVYSTEAASFEALFEEALEHGAENIEQEGEQHVVYTQVEDFAQVRDALHKKFGEALQSELIWKPQNMQELDEEKAASFLKFYDAMDDNDDVQKIWHNAIISDEIMSQHGWLF